MPSVLHKEEYKVNSATYQTTAGDRKAISHTNNINSK